MDDITKAFNGTVNHVNFYGIPVYHTKNNSLLKNEHYKNIFINKHIKDVNNMEHREQIKNLLTNWNLIDNKWIYCHNENNTKLFYYLCQIGNNYIKPIELDYFKK